MISDKMQQALNDQINAEFYSSYLYQSMGAWFAAENLDGMSAWMDAQAREEWGHGMKIYGFVLERGGEVKLQAIDAPPTDFDGPLAIFQASYEHEQKVTGLINDLVALADEEKDYASRSMLEWFVDEQVEEEATVEAIVEKLKMIKDSPNGLFMMDAQIGQRGGGE